MKDPKHVFLNIVLPTMILLPLISVLTGCFYVPWFEHRTGSRADFRQVVGPTNSNSPVRPGNITRAQVEGLLGAPAYVTADDRSVVYLTRTSFGFMVWPLCFQAEPASQKVYAVRLDFDPNGRLTSFERADSLNAFFMGRDADFEAVGKLERSGSSSRLVPTNR